jgi:hypothetical protein
MCFRKPKTPWRKIKRNKELRGGYKWKAMNKDVGEQGKRKYVYP